MTDRRVPGVGKPADKLFRCSECGREVRAVRAPRCPVHKSMRMKEVPKHA